MVPHPTVTGRKHILFCDLSIFIKHDYIEKGPLLKSLDSSLVPYDYRVSKCLENIFMEMNIEKIVHLSKKGIPGRKCC